jgi:hypothetical protein
MCVHAVELLRGCVKKRLRKGKQEAKVKVKKRKAGKGKIRN